MTLEQLYHLNEKFQEQASQVAELAPSGNLLDYSTALIRSAKRLDALLKKLLASKTEVRFVQIMSAMEEEMDEIIYMLDQLESANRKHKIRLITDFVKQGYEMLSMYSICCDQIIKRLVKEDEF